MAIELNKVVVPVDVNWTHSFTDSDRDELLRNRGIMPTIIHNIDIDEIPTYCMYGIYEIGLKTADNNNYRINIDNAISRKSWEWNIDFQADALTSIFKRFRYVKFQIDTNFTSVNLTAIRQNVRFSITLNLGSSTYTTYKEAQVMPNNLFFGGSFIIYFDSYTKEFNEITDIYIPA